MSEYISKEDISRVLQERIGANKSCLSNARKLGNHEGEQYFDKLEFEDEQIASLIEGLSSADVRPNIHGYWGRLTRVENVYSIDGVKTWGIKCQCDKCTFTTIVVEGFGFYDYCPHCGSRNEVEAGMREPKADDLSAIFEGVDSFSEADKEKMKSWNIEPKGEKGD